MTTTSAEGKLLHCYNAACGKNFYELENCDDSCVYHPGHPVFHDAYKSWSCCSKKTTDFTEFLNFPGCTKGKHSNVKPMSVNDKKSSSSLYNEKMESLMQEILNKPINRNCPSAERPSPDNPMVNLSTKISPNLKHQLDKLSTEVQKDSPDLVGSPDSIEAEIGTSCKNSGCNKSYEGISSNHEECLYHPGAPIFHEGMKYWSCCQRKTSDFENFLSQEGCQSGRHLWYKIKPKVDSDESRRTSCRFDWHQTGSDVVLTIYSKLPIPEKCVITANEVKLCVRITFGGNDEKIFAHQFILFGVIDKEKCYVEFTPSKVEICMKKIDKSSWSKLTLTQS